jgi:hypothetical protein
MSSSTFALPDLACRAARLPPNSPIVIGTEAHEALFCRTLVDTFNPTVHA